MTVLHVLLALAVAIGGKSNPVEENVADFQLLCQIAALADQEVPPADDGGKAAAAFADIEALNMSASTAEWQKLFSGAPADGSWSTKGKDYDGKDFQQDWAAKWDRWNAAKAKISSGAGDDKWLTRNPPPSGLLPKLQVRAQLKTLADAAAIRFAAFTAAQQKANTETKDAVNAELRQALYGRGSEQKAATEGKTVADADGYENSCHGAAGGKSIYGDMLCICGLDAGGNTDECFNGQITIAWDSNALTSLPQLLAKCPKKAASKLTEAGLEAALQTIGARIRHGVNVANEQQFLGKQTGGACSGAAGQLCVVYTSYYADNTAAGHLAIPWVTHLTSAAEKLAEHDAAVASMREESAALQQLQTAARTIYSQPGEPAVQGQEPQAKAATLADQRPKCEQYSGSETSCPEDSCIYDAKANKCNPKVIDGAAAEDKKDEKCTGKEQKDCEKATECKWENNACKDSSILVTKQFALSMVSAAFVALLF